MYEIMHLKHSITLISNDFCPSPLSLPKKSKYLGRDDMHEAGKKIIIPAFRCTNVEGLHPHPMPPGQIPIIPASFTIVLTPECKKELPEALHTDNEPYYLDINESFQPFYGVTS
jgi:hypothetical protein